MNPKSQTDRAAALTWGVKASFRGYVDSAGGTIEVGGGAERAADGAFVFLAAPDSDLRQGADGALEGVGRFLGEVRFTAHGGMLSVFLADPILQVGQSGAILTVADSPARTRRVEIAQLDPARATSENPGERLIPASLSLDGIFLLGDHYPLMTPLDPVCLALAAE